MGTRLNPERGRELQAHGRARLSSGAGLSPSVSAWFPVALGQHGSCLGGQGRLLRASLAQ